MATILWHPHGAVLCCVLCCAASVLHSLLAYAPGIILWLVGRLVGGCLSATLLLCGGCAVLCNIRAAQPSGLPARYNIIIYGWLSGGWAAAGQPHCCYAVVVLCCAVERWLGGCWSATLLPCGGRAVLCGWAVVGRLLVSHATAVRWLCCAVQHPCCIAVWPTCQVLSMVG